LVYDELRRLATAKLAHEKPGQTLQATALVHEAYLRLVDAEKVQNWPGGALFLFGEGSVRFLKETIDLGSRDFVDRNPGVYRKLSTKAGGEVISADAY
jgi:hypothetical protein